MLLRYKYTAGEVVPYRFTFKQFRAARRVAGRQEEFTTEARFRVLVADETFHLGVSHHHRALRVER